MGSSLKAGSVRDRTSRHAPAGSVAIAVALLLIALADGGYSGDALGAGTAIVWILVVVAMLVRPQRLGHVPPPLALATVFLIALLGLTALSLGWGNDDGAGFSEVVRLAGYLGVFVLAGLLAQPGGGRSILTAIAAGIVAVALVALASRLLGIGGGDADLAGQLPPSAGRLSYPLGYWNGLGALMALAVPALVHLAAETGAGRRRSVALAAMAPVLLTAYMTSSRGALLAALLGAGVMIAFATERRRAVAVLAAGIAVALPAMVGATVADGILDTPGTGSPGTAEWAVIALLLAGVLLALLAGAAMVRGMEKLGGLAAGRLRVPPRIAVSVAIAVLAGLVVLTGPGRLIDDFSSISSETRTEASTGILSASGSGRAQFWGTALDAFADEPLQGIGAGGYATYWNRHGSIGTPARNAHSEPLELLAELGIAGLASFLGFAGVIALAGLRRARGPGGALAGAGLGVLAAGSVGHLIDWTWQIPAVTVPMLIVGAGLAGSAFASSTRPEPSMGETKGTWAVPAPLAGAVLLVLAIPAIWAAGVLAVATTRIDQSKSALANGEPADAARAARAAIEIEPWAAEPWLQLAEIERTVDNVEASKRAARMGIQRAPDDFRGWLLVSTLEGQKGNGTLGANYAFRAVSLAPLLLPRIQEFDSATPRSGE
jgi:O-antigen ligase